MNWRIRKIWSTQINLINPWIYEIHAIWGFTQGFTKKSKDCTPDTRISWWDRWKEKWNSHRAACLLKGAPIRGGVGHTGVGWVMQGWGGSYRGGVDHTGVGWVIQGWGWSQRSGWVMQGWSGSCKGGVGHAGWESGGSYKGRMGWVIKILKYWKY